MRTAAEYLKLLKSLLPTGRAWNRELGSIITEVLYGFSDECSRVDERSDDLLVERSTLTANELITDHETDLGIPDECSDLNETIEARRKYANTKLIAYGRQNPAYFVELATALGYTCTVTESAAGTFAWQLNVFSGDLQTYFRVGTGRVGDRLASYPGSTLLNCVMNKYKPAHTKVEIIPLAERGFDYGFSKGFDSFGNDSLDYLQGGFSPGFGDGFKVYRGGGFERTAFSTGFNIAI